MLTVRTLLAISGVAVAALHAPVRAADDAVTPFDGGWDVTLTCPPHHEDDDAKGYVHRFAGEVTNGFLRATHGTEGQPSWHHLSGAIAPDGTALLTLDGIVNNPSHAINSAYRGKPYRYRVRATFDPQSGVGQRVGRRHCEFRFKHG